MRPGALDVDHLLAVDLSERVERRSRTQRHERNGHHRKQHTEHHDRHQRDDQRHNPPVHAAYINGAHRVGRFTHSVITRRAPLVADEYR